MKKFILAFFSTASLALATVIPGFRCTSNLDEIRFPNPSGYEVSYGSYSNAISNLPDRKTDIDDSIAAYVSQTMTNQTGFARTLATCATNNNIVIPTETWEYLNTH